MIFGIMGAMPDEVDQLCARLENVTVEPYGGVEYHKGTLAGKQVVVCCAGMGKANAAATTQVLITRFGAEKIIFSGIAGNMTSKIGIGDVVIGKTVLYHDAQLDMICQNPPYLKEYSGDPALIAAAEAACAACGVQSLTGKIATGDLFVGDSATKAAIEAKCAPDCVEMEGAAVSQIAAKNGVPCVILRAMSDNADEDGHEVLVVKNSAFRSTLPPPPRSWQLWSNPCNLADTKNRLALPACFLLEKLFQFDPVVLLKILQFLHQPLGAGRGVRVVFLGFDAVHDALAAPLGEHFGQIPGGSIGQGLHADAHFGVELCHGALALGRAAAGRDGRARLLVQFPVDIPLPQQLGLEAGFLRHGHDLLQRVFAHLGILHHGFQQVEVVVFLIFHIKRAPFWP